MLGLPHSLSQQGAGKAPPALVYATYVKSRLGTACSDRVGGRHIRRHTEGRGQGANRLRRLRVTYAYVGQYTM